MIKSTSAFSLIELSIVLIIIGLLIAGVIGGRSLIGTAKQRAFITELRNYEQAVSIFKVAYDRLPGDVENHGYMGTCSDNDTVYCNNNFVYTTSDFAAPYNTSSTIPTLLSAPFVDMFLAKIINFRPDPYNLNVLGSGTPNSNFYSWGSYSFITQASDVSIVTVLRQHSGTINLQFAPGLYSQVAKQVDEKIDDGIYNKGAFRTWIALDTDCYTLSIDTQCLKIFYEIIN
jgi:prepilin-type N-terminal cleavage/methylation domain-containing protein